MRDAPVFDPFRPQPFNVDLDAREIADDQRDMRGAGTITQSTTP